MLQCCSCQGCMHEAYYCSIRDGALNIEHVKEGHSPMRAAATMYCSACMARLTGLRIQERAKRAHRMHVCCRCPAPFTPLSLLPDLSDAPSHRAAHGGKIF